MRPEQAEATYLKGHVLFSVCTEGGHPGNSVLECVSQIEESACGVPFRDRQQCTEP